MTLLRPALLALTLLLIPAAETRALEIYAEFSAEPGAVSEARLYLNGVEVRDGVRLEPGKISHRPVGALPIGRHAVEVVVVDRTGVEHRHGWTFEVETPAVEFAASSRLGGGRREVSRGSERLEVVEPRAGTSRSRDGRQVVSGHAPPGASIEVEHDGLLVGVTEADAAGRFRLELLLQPGINELRIDAVAPGGTLVGSSLRLVRSLVSRPAMGRAERELRLRPPELRERDPGLTLSGSGGRGRR
ncbi:MAG: hypothetical protein AAF533_22655 [Acidobacteriota bacterium]